MKAIFHNKFHKFIKKITDQKLYGKIKDQVDSIIDDPKKDKYLEHPFRKYKIQSNSFTYKGNSYRIAYTVNFKEKEIIFLVIDSRENFYEKLARVI